MSYELKETGIELLNQLKDLTAAEYRSPFRAIGFPEQVLLQENLVQSAYFFDLIHNLYGSLKFHLDNDARPSAEANQYPDEAEAEYGMERDTVIPDSIEQEKKRDDDRGPLSDSEVQNARDALSSVESGEPPVHTDQANTVALIGEDHEDTESHEQSSGAAFKSLDKDEVVVREIEIEESSSSQYPQNPKRSFAKDFNEMATRLSTDLEKEAGAKVSEDPLDERNKQTAKVRSTQEKPAGHDELSSKKTERVKSFEDLIDDLSGSTDNRSEKTDWQALSNMGHTRATASRDMETSSLKNEKKEELNENSSFLSGNSEQYTHPQKRLNALLHYIIRKSGKEEVEEFLKVLQLAISASEKTRQEAGEEDVDYWISPSFSSMNDNPIERVDDAPTKRLVRAGDPEDQQDRAWDSGKNVDYIGEGDISEPTVPLLSTAVRYAKIDAARPNPLADLRSDYRRFYGE